MHAHRNHDPHGHSEEAAARKRGGSSHRAMLKTGGHCERARGGSIPGEAKIKAVEATEDDRKRGGKVHGEKPKMRLDKKRRANGGGVAAPSGLTGVAARSAGGGIAQRASGGRMTPKAPFTGAGGHKPPFPHDSMPIDDGGEGKHEGAGAMKRGGGMKGKKRAAGGAVNRRRGGKLEHDDGPDAVEDRSGGAPPKSRKLDAATGAGETTRERTGLPETGRADGGKWIAGAIKHPGALHRQLGVAEGEKIPAKKLAKAAHSDNPTLARRAKLAETLKGFHR